jgi:hypothetical protein
LYDERAVVVVDKLFANLHCITFLYFCESTKDWEP